MPKRLYLLDPSHQRRYRLDGVRPSHGMPDDPALQGHFRDHVILETSQLPHKVDLREEMTRVDDQLNVRSCTANALSGAYAYLVKKTSGQEINVSRLFIYYNARLQSKRSDRHISDEGCANTDGIEALKVFGTCLESIWPYDLTRVNKRPSDEAYAAAKSNRITDALRINVDLHEMKSALAQGFPFIFGLFLFQSFDHARKKGIVPMPNAFENHHNSHGSHAMVAVGYSDRSQVFIVRNSWGENWGDRGYCYIPYAYMMNKKLCFDLWMIRQLEADDMGHEHWDDDDAIDYTHDDNLDDEQDEYGYRVIELDDDEDEDDEKPVDYPQTDDDDEDDEKPVDYPQADVEDEDDEKPVDYPRIDDEDEDDEKPVDYPQTDNDDEDDEKPVDYPQTDVEDDE